MTVLRRLAFLPLCLLCATVQAGGTPEVLFILDSSGSMAEKVAGKQKIVAAKEVMHQIVPELDEAVRIGLIAYGHRRPADCTDIEVLVPAGSTDRAELLSQVDQLQPRGKTPISAAILAAASKLKLKDAETTIVLVSDGIETCGGDPCAVVRQLKASGVKFVLHVVGFDVDAAAAQQLQCTADAGNGLYFTADNPQELHSALKEVSAEVQEKVKQAEPANAKDKLIVSKLGKLKVTMPIGSEISLAHIQIDYAIGGKQARTVKKPKPDGQYPLRQGDYHVKLGFATPSYGRPTTTDLGTLSIKGGTTRELRLGSISFNLPEKLSKESPVETVLITDAGTNETIVTVRKSGNSYYHYKPKPIVGGIYNVVFTYPKGIPSVVARNIVVEPGKDTQITLSSAFQLKKADDIIGWELIPRSTQTADADEDGDEQVVAPEATVRVHTGNFGKHWLWMPYTVEPGIYDVNVFVDGMEEALPAAEGLKISAGDMLQFDAGF